MKNHKTKEKFRYRVRNPSQFIKSSFRTRKLKNYDGVKIIVGKLKNEDGLVAVQSYLFDKVNWTKLQACKWTRKTMRKDDMKIRIEEVTDKNVKLLSKEELYDLRNRAKQIYVPEFMKKAVTICTEIDRRKLPRFNTLLDRDVLKVKEDSKKVDQPPFASPELTDYEDEWYIRLVVDGQKGRRFKDSGYLSWINVADLRGAWYLYSEELGCFVGMIFDKYYGWDSSKAQLAMDELLGQKYYSNVGTEESIDKNLKDEDAKEVEDFGKFFDEITLEVSFKKIDEEEKTVTGIVYEPNVVDAQGDFMKADTIRKMAHHWMEKYQKYRESHNKDIDAEDVRVIESFIAPVTYAVGTEIVGAGSWVLTTKIQNEELWKKVKDGELNAYSIGGYGKRSVL